MKAIKSIRLITSVIAITIFIVALKSCKKATMDMQPNITAEDARAASIKAIKAKYGNVSAGIIFNVNKTADQFFYKNTSGKMVSLYGEGNFNPQNSNILCLYTCTNTSNPANLHIVYTLDYIQRFYLCESTSGTPPKSTVNVKWTVSAPFTITNETPDGVLNTWGTVKFTPSGGSATTLTSTANDPDFTVTNLGTDPSCGVNTLYSVTYSFTEVDNSNFASGTQLDASLSLSNDCALVGYLVTSGYISGPTFNQNAYLPCNRIDKVWINPPSTTANGNANGCTQPSGWQYIDYHQLEYRRKDVSSFNWGDQTSTVYWGTPSGGGSARPEFSPFDYVTLSQITSGSGWWLVRFRNVKTGTCDIINPYPSGPPNGNWGTSGLWITEAWQY